MSKGKSRALAVLFWTAGIAVYTTVVLWIGWKPIVHSLQSVHWGPILGMTLATIAALWVRVWKWRIALGPNANATSLFWLSKAAGEWSPGRVGELSPLLLQRFRTPRVAAWVVVDRILEMGTTLCLGLFGILFLRLPNVRAVWVSALAIGFVLLFTLWILSRERLFQNFAVRLRSHKRIGALAAFGAAMSVEVTGFKRAAPAAVVLTLLAGFVDVAAGLLLYHAFGFTVAFSLMAAVKGLHAVTSAIPLTPNATGVPYLTAAMLLHEFGNIPSEVIAAAIVLAVAITNVVFWLSAISAATNLKGPTA